MVASIDEKVLYYIDPFFEKIDIITRQERIEKMVIFRLYNYISI